jgi:hypothetical protein
VHRLSTKYLAAAAPVLVVRLASAAPAAPQETALAADGASALEAYAGRPRVEAVALDPSESIVVDGRLDEEAWRRAAPATHFTQRDPDLGQPATERTEVRFAYSERSLYMGVVCYDDDPGGVLGNTMERDGFLSADDRFMWTLDPTLDGRTGYFFEMNPSGAMGDSLLTGGGPGGGGRGGGVGRAWDGIWYANVGRSDAGWLLEVEIPFRTLNFDPGAPAWGVNFQRTIRRKNEESLWTGWARNQGVRRLTNAGLLTGLAHMSQGLGLDVQPYGLMKISDSPGEGLYTQLAERTGLFAAHYSTRLRLEGNLPAPVLTDPREPGTTNRTRTVLSRSSRAERAPGGLNTPGQTRMDTAGAPCRAADRAVAPAPRPSTKAARTAAFPPAGSCRSARRAALRR